VDEWLRQLTKCKRIDENGFEERTDRSGEIIAKAKYVDGNRRRGRPKKIFGRD